MPSGGPYPEGGWERDGSTEDYGDGGFTGGVQHGGSPPQVGFGVAFSLGSLPGTPSVPGAHPGKGFPSLHPAPSPSLG